MPNPPHSPSLNADASDAAGRAGYDAHSTPENADRRGSYDVLRIPHVSIPVRESKFIDKWRAMLISDFGGSPQLFVGDLLLWRTRVAVHEAIKAMFDAERIRLGLA